MDLTKQQQIKGAKKTMTKLNNYDYEFILELIDEAYSNQMIVIEESGDSPEYDDHIRLDEISKLYDKVNKSLI